METQDVRRHIFDFSRSNSQLMTVEVVRLAFLIIVLAVTIIYQVINSEFLSYDVFFSIYMILCISFLLNLAYLFRLEQLKNYWYITAALFVWETIYITNLIYFIGINQSLLVFLYLINIILCGVVFQRSGGLYLALFTSVCFSILLSIDTRIQGNSLYLAVGVNNLAFFTVAYLSGYLSEQLNFMGLELRERGRDIRILKNLNDMILDNIASGLITVDNNGQILQINKNAQQILHVNAATLGATIQLAPLDQLQIFSLPTHVAVEREVDFADERKLLRINASALNDGAGNKQGTVVVFEDITSIRQLEGRVQQSEKMAAIGQLAAGIAHEIRNPLASISGSVEMLRADIVKNEDDAKLMNIVIKEIDRLNKLITEFLDYARPQDVRLERTNISDLLSNLIEEVRLNPISQGVQFDVSIAPQIWIQGHRDKLKQAFLNILMNALQAFENIARKTITISIAEGPDSVQVEIADTGIGIDEKIVRKIFEPFLTTKSKGTGLGLAVVHSILTAHKAQIDVHSEKNKGTKFTIVFPV
ncbi:MAG: PAS domain-containing protein [Bdellovibrionaceae bacterium]|nr:PAS domain-containing protein [Pseudobdellovibrionaceae bacterium]